jgi:hypothetical protein
LNQLHYGQDYGNHEQHMDEPAKAVRRDYTQQPQHQEYHEDRPQHGYLLTLVDPMKRDIYVAVTGSSTAAHLRT